MDLFDRYGVLLRADGTNQLQRTLAALEQGYIRPDERSVSELAEYARRLAEELRFYNLSGQAAGDWRPFFEPLVDPATGEIRSTAELEVMLTRSEWPPHLALFMVFLKLFGHLQSEFNELPQRHLRHYYEGELRLARRAPIADRVHALFELSRNAPPIRLEAGTVLDAGTDPIGQPLTYTTDTELIVGNARVNEIRRVLLETDRRGATRIFSSDAISELEGSSWHTLGREQLPLDPSQRFMQEVSVGFALTSPILRMAEGTRTIRIRSVLQPALGSLTPPSPQDLSAGVDLSVTGEAGWIVPASASARIVEKGSLEAAGLEIAATADVAVLVSVLTFDEAAASIIDFDPAIHGTVAASNWPVLRFVLKPDSSLYDALAGMTLASVELTVTAKGVTDLVVQNDQGVLDAGKPLPLFGSQPLIGSNFYIGSSEIFGKVLRSLTLNFEWQKPPENLLNHYRSYFDFTDVELEQRFDRSFVLDVSLLYNRRWLTVLGSLQSMFGTPDRASRSITAPQSAFVFSGVDFHAQPSLEEGAAFEVGSKSGFLRLKLRGPTRDDLVDSVGMPYAGDIGFEAFGHAAFGRRYAAQALALSRWDGTGTGPSLPNEPYTPTLATLSLDYSASTQFVPGDLHADEQMYVLSTFGHTVAGADVPAHVVPVFEGRAELRLGIENLVVPGSISLLLQIDSGTSTSDVVLESSDVRWSYLSGPHWKVLPSDAVLRDTTLGFQQPGLVVLAVPSDASVEHTEMPAGLHWVRAVIRQAPGSAARTLSLRTQAVEAKLDAGTRTLADYGAQLVAGLAAGTITRLKRRVSAIKRVEQPFSSFGGREPETDAEFFRRSSERLRHRNRAVTAWDYERLVLERFPDVFKVKCLPHSDRNAEAAPGQLAVVIVPNLRNTNSNNPLEPRASAVLMEQIQSHLASGLKSAFASVHAIHPIYERVRVDAQVRFRHGYDAGFYSNVLNEDLRRFLSPWAYEEGRDIVFGARIYRSEILGFIEGRSYVDNVTHLNLYHLHDGPPRGGIAQMQIGIDFVVQPDPTPAIVAMRIGDDFVVGSGVETAEATQPHTILASHASHRIAPTTDETGCTGVTQLGIGYLTISLDFNVSGS